MVKQKKKKPKNLTICILVSHLAVLHRGRRRTITNHFFSISNKLLHPKNRASIASITTTYRGLCRSASTLRSISSFLSDKFMYLLFNFGKINFMSIIYIFNVCYPRIHLCSCCWSPYYWWNWNSVLSIKIFISFVGLRSINSPRIIWLEVFQRKSTTWRC